MKAHFSHIAVALAIAALGAACGGRTSSVNMSEERAKGALKANVNQRLELIGCVKPATKSGQGKYILDRVTLPPGEMEPQTDSSSAAVLIPRGSWVRLGGEDMHQYIGKEVLISGDLVNAPVGTAGHGGSGEPGSYVRWNETPASVPLVAVETVKVNRDTCGD